MSKRLSLVLLFLSAGICCGAQQDKMWLQSLESPKEKTDQLRPENEINKFGSYNYSQLLRGEFIGFIGDNYRRLRIFFSSVKQNPSDKKTYTVTGYSIVGENECSFKGKITLRQIRLFKEFHYGVDDEYADSVKAQGLFIGDFEFLEEPSTRNSGTFKGIMTSNWYLDQKGSLRYDDIEKFSDSYKNNQFIGTWTKYKSATSKICNWGVRRIPFSGDLDIGAGEFVPNPKYHNVGWKDYH